MFFRGVSVRMGSPFRVVLVLFPGRSCSGRVLPVLALWPFVVCDGVLGGCIFLRALFFVFLLCGLVDCIHVFGWGLFRYGGLDGILVT